MNWHEILNQADADALMRRFGGFHDGCLREVHLWTGHWVSDDLRMACTGDPDHRLRMLVQRQSRDPSSIELLFEEVTRFHLVPSPPNHDSIIFAATLLVREGVVFWSPSYEWSPESPSRDEETWVSANQLRWREVDWLGRKLRYGPGENDLV